METLDKLFRKQEMNILFLQEFTHHNFDTLREYTKVGTSIRGTAMIKKEELAIKNFTGLPSGLGIASDFQGYWLINNYAPSRTARGQERERFYNSELTYLQRFVMCNMISGETLLVYSTRPITRVSLTIAELLVVFSADST